MSSFYGGGAIIINEGGSVTPIPEGSQIYYDSQTESLIIDNSGMQPKETWSRVIYDETNGILIIDNSGLSGGGGVIEVGPVQPIEGKTQDSYILLSGLDYGHYSVSGYVKEGLGEQLQEVSNAYDIYVMKDSQTQNKVLSFYNVQGGIYYLNTIIYSQNGDIIEKRRTALNDQDETKASWGGF